MLPWRSVCSKERREWLREPHSAETVGEATGGLPGTWAPLRCPGEAPTLWVAPKCSNETRKGEKLCPLQFAPRTKCLRSRQWHSHASCTLRLWERAAESRRSVYCQTRLQTFTSSTLRWDPRRWDSIQQGTAEWYVAWSLFLAKYYAKLDHMKEQVILTPCCYTRITRYSRWY